MRVDPILHLDSCFIVRWIEENEEPSHHDARVKAKYHGRMQFRNTPATRKTFVKLKEPLASAPVLHADFDCDFIQWINAYYEGVAGTVRYRIDLTKVRGVEGEVVLLC